MPEMVTEERAIAWLKRRIELAGGPAKLAQALGVSRPLISMMASGRKPITGKVAKHLGLARVNAYELTLVVPSTLQEHYENQRRMWNDEIASEREHWNARNRGDVQEG
jgi:plasmid maintenance system antidote protein VapI